ncbi:phospho-N-acetylmuramoyl-pentapeptide-transferase [Thermocoleostomius sinensis]|uniref:Phospho-N-acetylmuramoyl-pentapeptide-transferase n=1 Tax=Thermocoleostomius sinensis A174 TaxID=2016057 RepID=A0A9E8ZH17_9CYAN|nr:phospho-N-acetylmuramoyl-pentapeptide-transferase [Thermocoleostomius sinensis]WAL61163.1 phospho-N-acetylmuramoyl-pentapeptide-transferase [Thermocoleostomius sinensis A174]
MDAKLIPDRTVGLTGNQLFIGLGAGLSTAALILDWWAGRSLLSSVSLTLPLVACFLLTAGLGYWVIPLLRQLKAGQVIRQDGPQAHLKKAGTPTMGGIFFVPVAVIMATLWSGFSPMVLAVAALTTAYAAIGWMDDWQILRKKSNKGISPRMKLTLQILFGSVFCLWLFLTQPIDFSTIALPLGITLPLGGLFWLLAGFVLVAESNATNLTDGLDGLAAGTGAIALMGLAALIVSNSPDLAVFCACMAGGCLGFLSHNHNPARVFMGDTGSLALGGALAAVGIVSHSLFGLLVLSGIFLAESLSVLAQVGYYKATKDDRGVGKRLLKMAPLHHHFELTGWSETQVVFRFYLIGGLLALLGLLVA